MSNLSYAFRSFFSLLGGTLPPDIAQAFGYSKAMPVKAPPTPPPPAKPPVDGAVTILSALQRDGRLVDFLMEDLGTFSDEQIGSVAREVQDKSRQSLARQLPLQPVIDGLEGSYTKVAGLPAESWKLVGNVPANGKAAGGLLRHRGWKTAKDAVIAPAEIEVE